MVSEIYNNTIFHNIIFLLYEFISKPLPLMSALQADEAESEADIWHACRHGHVDKVKELVNSEVLQQVDTEGRSLLHWAIDRNHVELAQWLLSQGSNYCYI